MNEPVEDPADAGCPDDSERDSEFLGDLDETGYDEIELDP